MPWSPVPQGDVPARPDFHVQTEVGAHDVGHRLRFKIVHAPGQAGPVSLVQGFVCQFVCECLGLLACRMAVVDVNLALFGYAEHAAGNRLEGNRNPAGISHARQLGE